MLDATPLFGYIGPETILPATSILAAVGGLLLAFGKFLLRPFKNGFCRLFGFKKTTEAAALPVTQTADGDKSN